MQWTTLDGTSWLVGAREVTEPVVAGVTVAGGLLAQPIEHLGIAALAAAWLASELSRPVDAVDLASGPRASVSYQIEAAHATFVIAGTEAGVARELERLDELVAAGPEDLPAELRDRARLVTNPLAPWSGHLAARWGGGPITVASFGPAALDVVPVDAVRAHVRDWYGPDRRVCWTNESRLPRLVSLRGPGSAAGPPPLPPGAPARTRGPGCVLARDGHELGSVLIPDSAGAEIGLVLLYNAIRRRLVDFEPLVADVTPHLLPLHAHLTLLGLVLSAPPGRPEATLAAAAQTLDGLAAEVSAPQAVAEVRANLADRRRTAPTGPETLAALARRGLLYGDRRTLADRAADLAGTSDDEVAAAVRQIAGSALLATPVDLPDEQLPYPLVENRQPVPVHGRRFRARYGGSRRIRFSADRVGGTVPGPRGKEVADSSIGFAELILRVDVADQATRLIDGQLDATVITWPLVRHADRLRAAVDERTAGVPRIWLPRDPELDGRVAALRQRFRRRVAVAVAVPVVVTGLIAGASVLVAARRDRPTEVEVVATEEVRLANGSTLAVVAQPELRPPTADGREPVPRLSVLVQMCGGRDTRAPVGSPKARNYAGPEKFVLVRPDGSSLAATSSPFARRPELPSIELAEEQCVSGWLTYRLAGPVAPTYLLRYENITGDRVRWRLPEPRRLGG